MIAFWTRPPFLKRKAVNTCCVACLALLLLGSRNSSHSLKAYLSSIPTGWSWLPTPTSGSCCSSFFINVSCLADFQNTSCLSWLEFMVRGEWERVHGSLCLLGSGKERVLWVYVVCFDLSGFHDSVYYFHDNVPCPLQGRLPRGHLCLKSKLVLLTLWSL